MKRLAYVCRDLANDAATGAGAQTFAAAAAMATAGHRVHLISDELAGAWLPRVAGIEGLSWQQVAQPRADHVYFTEQQCYADRVYDAVSALHAQAPLDLIELGGSGGEGLTLVRARRLLDEFAQTQLVLSRLAASSVRRGDQADQPTSFGAELAAYAENYVLTHADLVLSANETDIAGDGRFRCCRPALVDAIAPQNDDVRPGALAKTALWLGTIGPAAGLATVLDAVEFAITKPPGLRLVLHGDDTPTDPFGRSYWAHLHRRLSGSVRAAVSYAGPLRVNELGHLPPIGTRCVLGACATAADAVLAMAAGFSVIAFDGSIGAELVAANDSGQIVADGDAHALAEALLQTARLPQPAIERATTTSQRVGGRYAPQRVTDQRTVAYGWSPADRPPIDRPNTRPRRDVGAVSVVIPVYNQGAFLADAVDSVKRTGLPEVDIVVVDDGSTDPDTVSALNALRGPIVLRCDHRGLSAARNAGIAHARGDLILTLDADDLVAPGFLPAAVSAMDRHDEIAFVGGYVRYFGLLDMVYVPAGPALGLNLVLHTMLKSMVLYRRTALEDVGGYDEDMPAFEDWEVQLRLVQAGFGCDVLPVVGQLYRRHHESMSFSTSNGMRSELVQYIVRKHARSLSGPQLVSLLQTVVDLWKTGFEPSKSVLFQRAEGEHENISSSRVAR
jgi:GT2 family glycosyltransferase